VDEHLYFCSVNLEPNSLEGETMASYNELFDIARTNSELKNKILVACIIASEAIRTEDVGTPNHANRLAWAKAVFAAPDVEASRMIMAVLAQNKNFTPAQITGASDATIQTAVDTAVDVFATGPEV
jgi:hypothetical protein